jgi:hypothetical protein
MALRLGLLYVMARCVDLTGAALLASTISQRKLAPICVHQRGELLSSAPQFFLNQFDPLS